MRNVWMVCAVLACAPVPETTTEKVPEAAVVTYPVPRAADDVFLDTRAGGAQSIQQANTLAEAVRASTLRPKNQIKDGTNPPMPFTTDFDGKGTRAFRQDVLKNAGNPNGCVAGGPSQQNWHLERGFGGRGANGQSVYIQYKVWTGRTPTGGGVGPIGEFIVGGKKLVAFRNGIGNNGRYFAAARPTRAELVINKIANYAASGTRVITGEPAVTTPYQWTPGLAVVTFRLQSESQDGAGDGVFEFWLNETRIIHVPALHNGSAGLGAVQLGNVTWICPPQDQTQYFFDIVAWTGA
jgi:hypothetical protein